MTNKVVIQVGDPKHEPHCHCVLKRENFNKVACKLNIFHYSWHDDALRTGECHQKFAKVSC